MKRVEIRAMSLAEELAKLTPLEGRGADTPPEEADAAFGVLSSYRDGGVFAGSFSGESPWERHPADEFVQIVSGRATLTILDEEERHVLELEAGRVLVVPEGLWHRFQAPDGVSVLTITPGTTEHSDADDPRTNA